MEFFFFFFHPLLLLWRGELGLKFLPMASLMEGDEITENFNGHAY